MDEHKLRAVIATFEREINSAYEKKKLTPGALSSDVLHQSMYHIDSVANKNRFCIIRICPSADSFPFFSQHFRWAQCWPG